MAEVAISLKGVSKCFKRYARPVDRLKEILLPGKSRAVPFWAIQEIDLEIFRGETIGIVGQNGAGKSTLLQVITQTLTPTSGQLTVNGRISALLELGSGFNPEFTGRQNVFFNGRILGLSQAEIEQKFDTIVEFADIGDFIDQPVKTYSSGMFVRLAFAVAVNTDPDILIVDEALAVGDVYFQQKCFIRLRELREAGVTLLFVSHDSSAVCKLCDRAILLEHGRVILDATPRQVVDLYEAKLLQKQDQAPERIAIQMPQASTDAAITSTSVQLKYVQFLDADNHAIQSAFSDSKVQLAIGLTFLERMEDPHVGFRMRNRTGEVVFESNTFCMKHSIGAVEAGSSIEARFQFHLPLLAGDYTITIGIAEGGFSEHQFKRVLTMLHNTAVLKILQNPNAILWAGIVNLNPTFEIYRSSSTPDETLIEL
ncbi:MULTISPECIES: ABC transporter ATP-binding protein [Leptolyngbya]|jgi:lipopolysaccharide transport system ATP-binding protein|uniref:Teichoic-acid-transporting ATPase n=2 Tax=Leptolyngbya boryana TaxID=1184 RepID=A0A1Z4JKX1_LEPBY|nr:MULTISPECIES: ABC transporter ATP-binding protein [Leptolyngbya]BAY57384.1 teichoic-acid-transporting ATPase [Leptolyngbya boryana NIES-2135]MBD1859103.1 ABC transporter ATP-binding protein [Leptolyngbya sp. FACHB-1624]MBD2368676.1 ABC transporter ATP-binding protein [Leptolyngbya sp. FACHB-161]MBD2375063.1 ABC transporter ATP-binding protein [Leptolyngbya sp. FACHB-238]MBD2399482.1 ABC transporter ATP-binding protein [Leptolyngbya sp. FACHB-239]